MSRRRTERMMVAGFIMLGVITGCGKSEQGAECPLPCARDYLFGRAVLSVEPADVPAMKPLEFTLSHNPPLSAEAAPKLRLAMPAMDMGPNVVTLEAGENGRWSGRGLIPSCTSRDPVWRAELVVSDKVLTVFPLHVRY